MAPVWEANHVWLIFVLTVTWTAYPVFFGSVASTLSVPLLIAGIGIIFRGASYALRTASTTPREQRRIDAVFGLSSLIAPFALGAAAGAIAAGRVPVGNAAGPMFSSWLNPTSILIGVLAVVTGAYLAAVFMCGDATRRGERELAEAFRVRALAAGVLAGAVALAGFVVLHDDDPRLYHGLISGAGLIAVLLSAAAGTGTLLLVWARGYEMARYTAPVAVAAIIAGWALAQSPRMLPGLTVRQAAAGHDALVAVVVAILAGGALLFPALLTLVRLTLGGHLGQLEEDAPPTTVAPAPAVPPAPAAALARGQSRPGLLVRLAGALLVVGIGFMNVADAEWANLVGAASLLAFVVVAFLAVVPLSPPA
jgi:cytochrome d ubiquinol oxidase subunit II